LPSARSKDDHGYQEDPASSRSRDGHSCLQVFSLFTKIGYGKHVRLQGAQFQSCHLMLRATAYNCRRGFSAFYKIWKP